MRYSKQREMILKVVTDNKIHPTAEQVYELVRKENPTISLGTVYRDLNQLTEADKLLKLRFGGSKDRFDADIRTHYHVKLHKVRNISGRTGRIDTARHAFIIENQSDNGYDGFPNMHTV